MEVLSLSVDNLIHLIIIHSSPSGRAVCGRSLAEIMSSNPTGSASLCLSVLSVLCCQVQVSVMSLSLAQKNPTECGASFCVI